MNVSPDLPGQRQEPCLNVKPIPVERIRMPTAKRRPVGHPFVTLLKRSFDRHGLLQPIGIREIGEREYELVFGVWRFTAWRELYREAWGGFHRAGRPTMIPGDSVGYPKELLEFRRWEKIPAVVYGDGMTDEEAEEIALAENQHRVDLTADERAKLEAEYEALIKPKPVRTKPRAEAGR
jgi:ParB-like chromosome segregation protein Spo0J